MADGTTGTALGEARIRSVIRAASPTDVDAPELAAALAARADREGLIEVAYSSVDSPVGTLMVAATDAGLVRLGLAGTDHGLMLEQLAGTVGPRVIETSARFDPLRRELEEYFEGRRRRFEYPLDWRLTSGFVRTVLERTAEIPFGSTRTYAEMATLAGSPRAFRAAGSALGANPIPILVPCHRVLRKGGGLGGYAGGLDTKRTLLRIEGALE
ncbi:MAG: methylated-DNA--[protein]-cysteine S-methyltransferase [Solirubrobacterales bacterium]